MRKIIFVAILGAMTALPGCATLHKEPEYASTVILGTYAWNLESNTQGGLSDVVDFWWEQANGTERYLVPMNGTMVGLVRNIDFDRIDPAFIETQQLSGAKISGSSKGGLLTPGSIIVFRTAEGNLGKLQVVKYRASHDFSFPEVTYLSEKWKSYALKRPNTEMYHLQVRWYLFKKSFNHSSQRTSAEEPKPGYIIEDSYINFAWGYQNFGRYILPDGSVWCFDSSGKQPPIGYGSNIMAKYKNSKLLGKTELPDITVITDMIARASHGKIIRGEIIGFDRGGHGMRAFLYDSNTDRYQKVTLASSGGQDVSNSSQEAVELIKIFTKILEQYPLNEECSDQIIIYR